MTLVLTVNGRESIWLVADRRLSAQGRVLRDDARKVMFLETMDGVAILGYAGLGATSLGNEPSDWMSAVLRGTNLPLEQSLGILAEALKKQLPRHLVQMPGVSEPAHHVIVTAFLGDEVRLYTIDLVVAPDRRRFRFRYTRHVSGNTALAMPPTPRLGLGGTGALYLIQDKKWIRRLLCLVRDYDRGKVSSLAVADHLAALNNEVHVGLSDKSVGPRCIVAWRNRKEGIHKGGGGHQFYSGTKRDDTSSSLPTIASGMDVNAIAEMMMPHINQMFEAMRDGKTVKELDKDETNAELARLPDKPDENLR